MDARYVAAGSPRYAAGAQIARGPRSRLVRRAALAVAGLSTLALAAPAAADTETFNFTGAAQTWTVPAGVTEATFDLFGAQGGGIIGDATRAPGLGGRATATIPVAPGASIQVNVGGQGAAGSATGGGAGGFNGGGDGGFDDVIDDDAAGGGGGGASDIRIDGTTLDDRKLVAAGGGGAGGGTCAGGSSIGGGGGGETGQPGGDTGCQVAAAGGGGGTQSDGGTAALPAMPGDPGVGGHGAIEALFEAFGGGGGGGGWFGGGGGLGGGGGGGSGHGPEGTVFETGVRSGNGLVTVTYTVSPPVGGPPVGGPPVGGPPTGGPPPDNSFSFGKLKRNLDKGTAKLTVNVPGGGELELAKTKKVKADDESAEDAGKEKLLVKPRGKAKKKLNQTGKAKVKAKVTYTPTGGEPNTESKKVTLKLRPH